MKTTAIIIYPAIAIVMFACVALFPIAQAVSPAPDGGYPGGNTAEGQNALFSLTTGGFNTAVGYLSLRSNTIGSFNTAIGAGALLATVSDHPDTATENTATGAGALLSNTIGVRNTSNGAFALVSNTSGLENTALGRTALQSNTTGNENTATGVYALANNTTGSNNTAVGELALSSNVSGGSNTALGSRAGANVTSASNVICIGSVGNNVDDSCFIGNIFGSTSSNGVGVLINSNGRLGTVTSSKRFKEDIRPMDKASEALLALKPVTFRYKKEIDPEATSQFGLVAEDVQKVNSDLVVRDKEGKPYSVRYDQVNAMLLNEFLKEHRTVQELESEIAALNATVKEQAVQIQKVSARLDLHQTALQTVAKNSIE